MFNVYLYTLHTHIYTLYTAVATLESSIYQLLHDIQGTSVIYTMIPAQRQKKYYLFAGKVTFQMVLHDVDKYMFKMNEMLFR